MDKMCLNKKIRLGMKKSNVDTSIFANEGLQFMLYEMRHNELDLITFCALADIYKVDYTFTIKIKTPELIRTRVIKSIDNITLWNEIDSLYYEYTEKVLDSGCMCYREIFEVFDKINGEVSFM
jgi:hypothetical protein